MKPFFFVIRHAARWFAVLFAAVLLWKESFRYGPAWLMVLIILVPTGLALINACGRHSRGGGNLAWIPATRE